MSKRKVIIAPKNSKANSKSATATNNAPIFECEDCHTQICRSIQYAYRCDCCGKPFYYCPVCGGAAALITD